MLKVLGVPFAGLIALFVAIADLIPLVGATLGAVVAVVAGFVHSVPAGIAVIVFFVLYQQLENHLLQPLILSRTVELNPLTVLVAILVAVELAGILGALLAIPVAGMVQVVAAGPLGQPAGPAQGRADSRARRNAPPSHRPRRRPRGGGASGRRRLWGLGRRLAWRWRLAAAGPAAADLPAQRAGRGVVELEEQPVAARAGREHGLPRGGALRGHAHEPGRVRAGHRPALTRRAHRPAGRRPSRGHVQSCAVGRPERASSTRGSAPAGRPSSAAGRGQVVRRPTAGSSGGRQLAAAVPEQLLRGAVGGGDPAAPSVTSTGPPR